MARLIAAAAFALALAGAQSAFAQTWPESSLALTPDCAPRVTSPARAIAFAPDEPLSETGRRSLSAAVFRSLGASAAAEWPGPQIEAAPPCPIARFAAADGTWTISAGSGAVPHRWIRANGSEDFFFVAHGPPPADRAASAKDAYYLALASMDLHAVYKVYDGAPDNTQIAEDVARILERGAQALAVHDPAGAAVTVLLPTESGHKAELFEPDAIHDGRSAALFGPDGRFFTDGAGEAIHLRGSNLPCAPVYGAFTRERLLVVDAREQTLDLACRLVADEGWITIFASRVPNARDDRRLFAERLRDAQSAGVARRLKALPTGPARPLQAGQQWVDRDGVGQAVWFMRRGEFVIELRATYAPALEQAVLEVLAPVSEGRLPESRRLREPETG